MWITACANTAKSCCSFSFKYWNWFDVLNYSSVSCQSVMYFLAFLNFAGQYQIVLMSFDRFLAVFCATYQRKLMRNIQYPIICSFINYSSTAVLTVPLLYLMHVDPVAGVCMGNKVLDDLLASIYSVLLAVLFSVSPFVLILIFNVLVFFKMR